MPPKRRPSRGEGNGSTSSPPTAVQAATIPRCGRKWCILVFSMCFVFCFVWFLLNSPAVTHPSTQIVPPVLNFDQDGGVRGTACEALYNIPKDVKGDVLVFFIQIFDVLCKLSADANANGQSVAHLLDLLVKDSVAKSDQFSIEDFLPLLREHMNVLNPSVQQFLISKAITWTTSPDELTRFTAITWINEFVELGGDQLVPYYADILGAIFPCISDKEEKIRVVARDTNKALRAIKVDPAEGFDVGAVLSIARRQLSSEWEATRIEALYWISNLLNRRHSEVLTYMNDIFGSLLEALTDPSDQVVLLVLELHACIAKDTQHFRQLVVFLAQEKHGALIIGRFYVLLDAQIFYRELSNRLEESYLDFASIVVQRFSDTSGDIKSLENKPPNRIVPNIPSRIVGIVSIFFCFLYVF